MGTKACAEQNKEFHIQTVCRSNEVEERDGVRSQRQSFLPVRQAGLVTSRLRWRYGGQVCDDKKLQKKVNVG
jgi:hypothetical protein